MFYLPRSNWLVVYYDDNLSRDLYTYVNADDLTNGQYSSYLWAAWINYAALKFTAYG